MVPEEVSTTKTENVSTQPLYYSLLRFVPDSARGEFVNIGVVVVSENSYRLCWSTNSTRAQSFIDDPSLVEGIVDSFEREIQAEVEINKEWLKKEVGRRCNLLQLSDPLPIAHMPIEEAVELVFDRMVR